MNKIDFEIKMSQKIFSPLRIDSDRSILGEKINFEKIAEKSKKKFLKIINKKK